MSRLFVSLFFGSFYGVSFLSAATLDWSTVTWPAGSTSQSYEVDSSNPGNDITISMTSSSLNQFSADTKHGILSYSSALYAFNRMADDR
jgi:hypothetical protein